MQWRYGRWLLGLILLVSLGCSQHTISPSVRQQAAPAIPFADLRANPDTYIGRTVILGGPILSTRNTEPHTFVEVLQKPLDRFETPYFTDQTEGRFIARCDTYLDPAIYARKRHVTIAGRVLGRHVGQVGETAYVYPLITCEETHLWPRVTPMARYPHHSFYDDFLYPWPWHPFHHHHLYPYDGFYRYRYRRRH